MKRLIKENEIETVSLSSIDDFSLVGGQMIPGGDKYYIGKNRDGSFSLFNAQFQPRFEYVSFNLKGLCRELMDEGRILFVFKHTTAIHTWLGTD